MIRTNCASELNEDRQRKLVCVELIFLLLFRLSDDLTEVTVKVFHLHFGGNAVHRNYPLLLVSILPS